VENHCLFDEDFYYVPDYGFKLADLVIYLNHYYTPNVVSINDGEFFEAIIDIKAGEELLVDYGTIVDSEE
jgi:SET domain-containing protein